MSRKPISKKLRFEIFKRDAFSCQYCGATPPDVILHVDHIHPVSKGGDNSMDNLITSCSGCNHGKMDIELTSIPKSLQERAAEISEQEAQIKGYTKVLVAQRKRLQKDIQAVCDALVGEENSNLIDEVKKTIRMFCLKLHPMVVLEFAEMAQSRFPGNGMRTFKYFCGICWNHIKGN